MKIFYTKVEAYDGRPEEGVLLGNGILTFNAHSLGEAAKRSKGLRRDAKVKQAYANALSACLGGTTDSWERRMRLKVSQVQIIEEGSEFVLNGNGNGVREFPVKHFAFQH